MKLKVMIILIGVVLFFSSHSFGSDDVQYWSQYNLKLVDGEHVDVKFYGEGRIYNDVEDLGLYLGSLRVTYDYIDHLQFGTNYTYINYKSRSSNDILGDWRFQHRAEVEVNPYFNIGDHLKVSIRNRMEFRWIENRGSYNTRFRHRWTFAYPLKDMGILKKVYANTEFMYNLAEHTYDENRTVPLGLTFRINDKTSLNTFYMIQTKKGSDDWAASHILGTMFSYKF